MRPTYADDGAMLDNKSEVRLWRQAMEHLYGADWLEDLSLRTAGPAAQRAEASGPAASADQGADRSGTAVPAAPAERPAAAQEIAFVRAAAAAARGRVSPGSGDQTRPVRSPGSGERTPRNPPSWHSSNPGSPAGLLKNVTATFDPSKEPIAEYISRLTRQATALETLGHPLGTSFRNPDREGKVRRTNLRRGAR